MTYRIGFAGTDGRTVISALTVSSTRSAGENFRGIVVRGMPGMKHYAEEMQWPVDFIPTSSNEVAAYAEVLIAAFTERQLDLAVPMPEALQFDGLVDLLEKAGFGERIIGLAARGARLEGDKIYGKRLCRTAGIPVADAWIDVDAKNFGLVREVCLAFIGRYGGAVLKYPYSAAGKGARVIHNAWEVHEVWRQLMDDYMKSYTEFCGADAPWPLLIESLMSGVEMSFTAIIDGEGHIQVLPTALDYPERFPGIATKANPITGGMASISPHPLETDALIAMARATIFDPLVKVMREEGILRPCILYPGCFVTVNGKMEPLAIRVSEVNVRTGEPEFQTKAKRLKNLPQLLHAAAEGNLDEVAPEVRVDQISMSLALVVGPGGPNGQRGYPWSCTKGEAMSIDQRYLEKNGILLVPSGMDFSGQAGVYLSDGTRICYLIANALVSQAGMGAAGHNLRDKLLRAFHQGRVRVIPREDASLSGNRLVIREDAGIHFKLAEDVFARE